MGAFLNARRRHIQSRGRTMKLQRMSTSGVVEVAVLGFARSYTSEDLVEGIKLGDMKVSLLNDEIAAASWPAPPGRPDRMVIDGRPWAIQGAMQVYEATVLIGWELTVRGG